jgi:hypothetical protein
VYLILSLQLPVDHLQQCFRLVFESTKSRVFPEDDSPVLVNYHVHPACNGKKPVISIICLHYFFINIGKQCEIIEVLIGDKFPVQFLRIDADAKYLYVT